VCLVFFVSLWCSLIGLTAVALMWLSGVGCLAYRRSVSRSFLLGDKYAILYSGCVEFLRVTQLCRAVGIFEGDGGTGSKRLSRNAYILFVLCLIAHYGIKSCVTILSLQSTEIEE